MVAAWQASAHTGYGGAASTSIVVTAPAGIAAGDIALVWLQIEQTAMTITMPTGWALKQSAVSSSGSTISGYLMWKRLTGSEVAADWTFSWPTSSWRTADAHLIRGAAASGDPFGGTVGTSTGSTATRASVAYTTSGAGLGVWLHTQFQDSNAVTLPSGYTARHSSTEHESRLASRADAAGSLSSPATTGWAGVHVMMAQTILDTAAGPGGSVTAVAATATALAEPPAVSTQTTISDGGPATATAEAVPPVVLGDTTPVSVEVVAVRATATAAAPAPVPGSAIAVLAPVALATTSIHAPGVTVVVPTYRFTPPTFEAPMQTLVRPFNYFRLTYAASIVRVNGTLTEVLAPNTDLLTAAGEEGVDYFLGGRIYDVSAATKAELQAAGYTVE